MNPELISEGVSANALLLSLTESMSVPRQRVMGFQVLRSLPKWVNTILTLTLAQAAYIFLIPIVWKTQRATDEMVDRFRDIDITRYNSETADRFCKLLIEFCDFVDQRICEIKDLQLHRILCLRWAYNRNVRAKQALEDTLETWLLMRNPEFVDLMSSVLSELKDYSGKELERLEKTFD